MRETDLELVSRSTLPDGSILERVINAGGVGYSLIIDKDGNEAGSLPTTDEARLVKWWNDQYGKIDIWTEQEESIISTIKEMGLYRTPYACNEVEKVVSKAIKLAEDDSFKKKAGIVIDQLRKDRDALLSAITQIRDYGQEKIDRCRNFDTDSIVNLGDIMHMTNIANEVLGGGAGEDLDELIKEKI